MNATPFASGFLAEVYAWSPGWVLKLFRAGFPVEYVQHEANITQTARTAGLPAPEVGEVLEVDERFGVVLEHVVGTTLLEHWAQAPQTYTFIAQRLAELHCAVHETTTFDTQTLPSQREWMGNNVQDSTELPADLKGQVLALLDQLPDGDALCHGDFHPGNVLLKEDQTLVVIDWFSAVRGNPLADVARTALAIEFGPLPTHLAAGSTSTYQSALSQAYVEAYCARRPIDQTQLRAWRVVMAAAHLEMMGVEQVQQLLEAAQG